MIDFISLNVSGFHDEPISNMYFQQKAPPDRLAIFLPGMGYTCDRPLLYYPTQWLIDQGTDVFWVEYNYVRQPEYMMLPERERAKWTFADVSAACQAVLSQRAYQQVILVGKSLGTLAMGHLLRSGILGDALTPIWLTPLLHNAWLRERISEDGRPGLFISGTADPHFDTQGMADASQTAGSEVLLIEGADHSLEIAGDLWSTLQTLEQVMRSVTRFIQNT